MLKETVIIEDFCMFHQKPVKVRCTHIKEEHTSLLVKTKIFCENNFPCQKEHIDCKHASNQLGAGCLRKIDNGNTLEI